MDESEKSVGWVTAALMIAIAVLGWGFLAGSYSAAQAKKMSEMSAEEIEDLLTPSTTSISRKAKGRFISNAIELLPEMPTVISWHIANRVWLPAIFVGLEVLAVVLGIKMKSLEKELSQPRRRKR